MRDWASPARVLHMVVGEDQLPAAQALLAFLYAAALPGTLPQADLLQLLLLADRFDVAAAVAAARRALAALSPAALEWVTLVGLWSLPGHLFEGEPGELGVSQSVGFVGDCRLPPRLSTTQSLLLSACVAPPTPNRRRGGRRAAACRVGPPAAAVW